ncbi:unnamed protein product [Urochloa decumbens]|uniref:Uncharacterized protein n=1 Tax=Urochloa decumbens TaxID=240449 RepID=A0ABC9BNC3_9POAL
MAYEAAAAVALRDQSQLRSREGKGGGGARRRRQQQQVEEEKAAVRCGVLRMLRRAFHFHLSVAPAPSEKKRRVHTHGGWLMVP